MAVVIDEFLVTLGFDTKGLAKGQKEAIDAQDKTQKSVVKTGKVIETESKKATEFLSKMTKQVVELYAVFLGGRGLKEFVSDITASDSALGRLARNVNLSVGTLGQWEVAARLAGGSAEGMAATFQTFSDNIQQLKLTGQSNVIPLFRAMEAAGHTLIDQSKPLPDIILAISSNLATLAKTDRPEADYLARQLGFADPAFRAALLAGPDAMQRYLNAAKKLAPTEADTNAAIKRQEAWNKLTTAWERASRILVTALTPAIDWFVRALTRLGNAAAAHPIIFGAIVAIIGTLAAVMAGAAFASIIGGLGALASAFTAATAAASGLLAALGWVGLTVAVGAGAFAGINALSGDKGAKNRASWFGGGNTSADASNGPIGDLSSAIIGAEGTGAGGRNPYDTSFGFAASPKPLSQMTLDESLAWGEQIRAMNPGLNTSAKGAFQIENSTQRDAMRALGLKGSDSFNATNQQLMMLWIWQNQGLGAWSGFATHPNELAAAKAAGSTVGSMTSDSVAAALRKAGSVPSTSGIGAGARAGATYGPQSNNTSSSETHVGTVVVNTAATDAKGIATDMKAALQRTSFAANANFSLVG